MSGKIETPMLVSMTGYGQASSNVEEISYSLEIKSLNGKYLKTVIKLPETLSCYEPRIEQILRQRLIRGSIVYALRVRDNSEQASWEVNASAVKSYLRALERVADKAETGMPVQIDLASILLLPGVCQLPEASPVELERQWQILCQLTERAMEQVTAMRAEEGAALQADLAKHCQRITEDLEQIKSKASDVLRDYAKKLRDRVNALLTDVEVALREDDLAREVAIFAERSDINEELSRLSSHLRQFMSIMETESNAGRKLEFLAQEMLRETNTIGAKANDAQVAQRVVDIKGHIDRIKEQIMNAV